MTQCLQKEILYHILNKESNMKIIYSQQPIPTRITKSIFLAGCTPRDKETPSWRKNALTFLENLGFDGTVFVPEFEGDVISENLDYSAQIEWEEKCLNISDVIVFWIDRNLTTMLGLTSNIEYGKWMDSGKVMLGYPETAEKMRYLEYYAEKLFIPSFRTMQSLLISAVDKLGEGSLRIKGEVNIPLDVWEHKGFINWYKSLVDASNILEDARVEYRKFVGKDNNILFFVSLWAKIYITDENRYKENEIVFMRSDISACVLFRKDEENILNSDIVLVKEFRTPVSNYSGKVWELAGGSTFKENVDPKDIMVSELHEETGLDISSDRLEYYQTRQLQATSLSHKAYLYYCKITEEEVEQIKELRGKIFGNIEDTERTFVEVVKLESILNTELVDWANMGQILSILIKK